MTTESDTFPYPTGRVVGILVDDATFADARQALERSGFEAGDYDVLHGEEGLARIDVDGAQHGHGGKFLRKLQAVFGDDSEDAGRFAEHLRAGHYIVGVAVGEDEAAKLRAADALRAGRAESIDYFGDTYVETLNS
ncbi:hypothetical protein OJ998_25720 [Solirubrobacter taibaiensis]|nr:hypothetical protein [Solirubrobacter taibaiensis]